MKPFLQGHLDSWCGVYSILNAYKIVEEVDDSQCQILFDDIVEYLSRKRLLKSTLIGGMSLKEMNMIMGNVVYKYMPNHSISWRSFQNPNTKTFWNSMISHLTSPRTCIILGTSGRENHWTVGVSANKRTMKLLDSGGWKYLRYSMCSTEKIDERIYTLYPAQTYFISKKLEN